jgi:hypothetical protein
MNDPNSSRMRVFGIGLPKTGLTSLARLMQTIGFLNDSVGRQLQRRYFVEKDYSTILNHYDSGVFFCDGPTCMMYKEAFYKYGRDAKFILTVRRDAQLWLDSLKRHNMYAGVKNKTKWIFGRFYPVGFDDELKSYYERHTRDAIKFFEDHEASDLLLVLRCDEPGAVARVSEFLGVSFPVGEFPHENVSPANRRGLSNFAKKYYNLVAQALYARVAPRIPIRLRQPSRPIDLSGDRLRDSGSSRA